LPGSSDDCAGDSFGAHAASVPMAIAVITVKMFLPARKTVCPIYFVTDFVTVITRRCSLLGVVFPATGYGSSRNEIRCPSKS